MRLRRCKGCGRDYESDGAEAYLCPECRLASRRASVVRDRTCKGCGVTFPGGPRASYCPECRGARQRAANRRHKRQGAARPLGSVDLCVRCGGEYVVAGGRQRYCPACAEEAVKEAVRPKKRAYNAARREELAARKAAARTDSRVCVVCGKAFSSPLPTVTCSPECAKAHQREGQAAADAKRLPRKKKEP